MFMGRFGWWSSLRHCSCSSKFADGLHRFHSPTIPSSLRTRDTHKNQPIMHGNSSSRPSSSSYVLPRSLSPIHFTPPIQVLQPPTRFLTTRLRIRLALTFLHANLSPPSLFGMITFPITYLPDFLLATSSTMAPSLLPQASPASLSDTSGGAYGAGPQPRGYAG